jgi:hypothetical protein
MMRRFLNTLLIFLLGTAYAAPCPSGSDRFVWPTTGPAGSPVGYRIHPIYGDRRWHNGLDVAAQLGTPVVAAGGGIVQVRDQGNVGYGKYVVIKHRNGTETLYGHLNSVNVRDGQPVSQGQQIGTVGSTGGSTGPHLHFEINNSSGAPLTVNGQHWDAASDATRGTPLSAGSCMSMAAGPGGAVEGQPGVGDPGSGATINPDGTINTDGVTLETLDLETLLPTPKEWIDATLKVMADFQLAKHLNTLGFVLLFACFIYALISANYFYQSDQYFSLMGRLIIAAGLIWGSPAITNGMVLTWESVHDNMHTSIVKPATTELQNGINNFAPLLAVVGTATALANAGGALTPDTIPGLDVVEKVLYGIGTITGTITGSLFALMILMGSIYGIYLLMIYVSGMIAVLAGVLLPVLAAFLVLPGSTGWFTRWFNMIVMSLVSVVVLPFVLYVVVMVGVKDPITKSNAIAQQMVTEINTVKEEIVKGPNLLLAIFSREAALAEYASRVIPVMINAFKNLMGLMLQWIFSLILLAIAVLAGVYLIQQTPNILTGFLGGAFGRGASPASGGVLAAGIASAAGAFAGAASAGSNRLAKSGGDKDTNTSQKSLPASTPAGGPRTQAALPPAGGSSASSPGQGNSPTGSSSNRYRGNGTTTLSKEESAQLRSNPTVINVKSKRV